jgi:hypothetical protein
MNKATMKSRATLIGKVFASKGVTLTRAEQLKLVAQLEGARDWHHASSEMACRSAPKAFDSLQQEAVQAYCAGNFAHLTDDSDIHDVGDTLFTFVISEIGDASGDRDEAVRMMRNASRELEEVADYLESQTTPAENPALSCGPLATNSRGYSADWNLRFISDRFCELQEDLDKSQPDLAKWARENDAEFQRLSDACHEELAFIVDLGGEKGVLYEVEIETLESEGNKPDGTPHCNVSEAVRRIQLQNAISKLEKTHSHLSWVIGEPGSVGNGRLAVWAFSPASSLVNEEEIKALTKDLYDQFY